MADNRQFTDHNSIGNVNVYYKDRQLKERTAVSNAASIANLKFLLTTGDDEGFRTAIKSYIDEAIRSALGALVDNLDKGTGVSRILGTDSSHDLGTITPANLASVLGVQQLNFGATHSSFEQVVNSAPTNKLLFGKFNPDVNWLIIGFTIGGYAAFFGLTYTDAVPTPICRKFNGEWTWLLS